MLIGGLFAARYLSGLKFEVNMKYTVCFPSNVTNSHSVVSLGSYQVTVGNKPINVHIHEHQES